MAAAVFFLLFYGLAIPSIPIVAVLYLQRRRGWSRQKVNCVFGFFLLAYHPGAFFWDAVIMLQKLLVTLIAALVPVKLQAAVAIVVLVLLAVLESFIKSTWSI